MDNEHSAVDKFINNNINIREKLRVEEVLGLMDIPKTVIIHNMRQNLKLEKEAAMKNLSNNTHNFSRTAKEPKSPTRNEKPNIQILNYNPYGTTIAFNKPALQSNYIYNITKKERETNCVNQFTPNINVIEEAKITTPINMQNKRVDLKRIKEEVKSSNMDKSNIIKSIKGKNKNKEDGLNSTQNIRKGDLNSFLKERYENQKQKIEKENLIKQAEEQKKLLEYEIRSVEKLRNAFTDLLPKVMDSIKIIDTKETGDKNLTTKNYRFKESEINKNTNINMNTFTNSNLKSNPVTIQSNNKITRISDNNSNREISTNNSNYYKSPAYEQEFRSKDLFYNPRKNYFLKNKYKKLLQ